MLIARAILWTIEMMISILVLVVGADWVMSQMGAPWWSQLIVGGAIGLAVSIVLRWRLSRWQFKQFEKAILPSQIWVDPDVMNPMDPRGDGKLRPGDAMFDNVVMPLMRGEYPNGVMVTGMDGVFEVHEPPKGVVIERRDDQ